MGSGLAPAYPQQMAERVGTMEELTGWFERQAKRQQNALYLENALLSDRFWAYAVLRLRYFMVAYLTETVIHTLKIFLIIRFFVGEHFTVIILLHACSALINSFWWGSLEVMRGRIRHLYRIGRPFLISRETGRWVSFAGQLAAVTTVAALAWMVWRLGWQGREFGPADLYVFAMFVSLALTFVTRCYHSGIYAIRRIYRPLPAIVALELVAFLAALALWFWVDAWSFPIAAMLSTFVAAALTLHTTGRMYRFFGFNLQRYLNLRQGRAPWQGRLGEVLAGGLSFAVTRVDSLLIVVLLAGANSQSDGRLFPLILFVLSPTIQAGFEWAQLFYFDLKRLEHGLFTHLRQRFEKSVWSLAWVLGLMFGGLASLISLALLPRVTATLPMLAPFFVARSLLAKAQVQAFASRDYWPLLASGVVSLCGFAVAGLADVQGSLKFLLMAAACLSALAPLNLWGGRLWRDSQSGEPLSLAEWVHHLSQVIVPVRISVVQMGRERGLRRPDEAKGWWQRYRWQHQWFVEQLAWKLRRAGRSILIGNGRIAWYERVNGKPAVSEEWLLTQGGGRVARFHHTGVYGTGGAAVEAACRLGYLSDGLGLEHYLGAVPTASDAREAFRELLPGGVVYDPTEETPPLFHSLSSEEKRVILFDAVAFARDLDPISKNSRFDVTAFADKSGLRLIFVADANVDQRSRARWRTLVRRFNLQAALNGSTRKTAQPHVQGDRVFVTFNRTHP